VIAAGHGPSRILACVPPRAHTVTAAHTQAHASTSRPRHTFFHEGEASQAYCTCTYMWAQCLAVDAVVDNSMCHWHRSTGAQEQLAAVLRYTARTGSIVGAGDTLGQVGGRALGEPAAGLDAAIAMLEVLHGALVVHQYFHHLHMYHVVSYDIIYYIT
jgi:hypothetical protein